MSFVVIEGLDGSGKSTQIHKMLKYFELRKIEYQYLHFPRTSAPVYGELIARFLRGNSARLTACILTWLPFCMQATAWMPPE